MKKNALELIDRRIFELEQEKTNAETPEDYANYHSRWREAHLIRTMIQGA